MQQKVQASLFTTSIAQRVAIPAKSIAFKPASFGTKSMLRPSVISKVPQKTSLRASHQMGHSSLSMSSSSFSLGSKPVSSFKINATASSGSKQSTVIASSLNVPAPNYFASFK
jgi:hypothetical protein